MKFYIIVFLLFCAGNLAAQNNIESILISIEKNNKELQASEQLTLSKKLENRSSASKCCLMQKQSVSIWFLSFNNKSY